MSLSSHRKVVVERSTVDHDAFADWYRFGPDTESGVPLVAYFGGAISSDFYNARRDTEPRTLVDLFEEQLRPTDLRSVDLLVVPYPLIGRTYPEFRSRVIPFVIEELLARTPNPTPEMMAFFGNSAGAHIAATIAFELEHVRALATTAAVGLAEAAEESERRLFAGKRYLSFANAGDPCSQYTHASWEAMILRGIPVDVIEREGGHGFDDYVANGSAHEAFAWLLSCLTTKA